MTDTATKVGASGNEMVDAEHITGTWMMQQTWVSMLHPFVHRLRYRHKLLLSCNALHMKTNLHFWAFMVLGVFPCALRADVPETEHGEPIEETVYKELAYVSDGHARQKLDLYLPEGKGPFPVLVWIHGGAWRAGSKDRARGLDWLNRGVAVASVNYRLSQHATFPAQIEDCKSALRWLRAHAQTYHLDADRFLAWGASAGGHLVALLGVTGDTRSFDVGDHLHQSSAVLAVVDEYGPTDFLQMDAMDGDSGRIAHDSADSPESQLIGGPIQEHPEKVQSANPLTYVSKNDASFLIIHGDRDPLVAHGQSVILHDALQHAGVEAKLYTVKGGKHGWFKDPQVTKNIHAFIMKHLGLENL